MHLYELPRFLFLPGSWFIVTIFSRYVEIYSLFESLVVTFSCCGLWKQSGRRDRPIENSLSWYCGRRFEVLRKICMQGECMPSRQEINIRDGERKNFVQEKVWSDAIQSIVCISHLNAVKCCLQATEPEPKKTCFQRWWASFLHRMKKQKKTEQPKPVDSAL